MGFLGLFFRGGVPAAVLVSPGGLACCFDVVFAGMTRNLSTWLVYPLIILKLKLSLDLFSLENMSGKWGWMEEEGSARFTLPGNDLKMGFE